MNHRVCTLVLLNLVLTAACLTPGLLTETADSAPAVAAAPATPSPCPPTPTPVVRSQQELLQAVFHPGNIEGQDYNRLLHGNPIDWPEMRYLSEEALLAGHTLTPTAVRVIPGSAQAILMYAPQGDEIRDATHLFENDWWRFNRPATIPVVFIPPGGSLVMVYLDLDPSAGHWDPERGTVCDCTDYSGPDPAALRLSYPGLGEHSMPLSGTGCTETFCPYNLESFTQPAWRCPGSGWYYFYLPSREVDPALLWLEYVTSGELAFWTLTERP